MGKEQFTIARIFGAYYELYSEKTSYVLAVLKGKLRLKNSEDRHPFVVGDEVYAEAGPGEEWVILSKEDRKNFLTRKSDHGDTHVLCANLDQVAILASYKDPETKDGFIDRLLVASYHTRIKPLILFTKSDLVPEEIKSLKENSYRNLGYEVMSISVENESSLEPLWDVLRGKRTFLCGNSGVGKSTLLNHLTKKSVQKTNQISGTTRKGKHTTTNSLAVFLEENTVIIDSPGVKEWGILHLTKQELLESFPELQGAQEKCESSYCCDLGPQCNMLSHFEENLTESRKKSLESMFESLEKPHRVTRRDHWSRAVTKRY
ncbi:ribosome small subunit-dependent GTPase A [Leptospira idonii]|uniref:Small ribosomal subunit biogenesis GTPase RsgA n=1 Tax=Leptospira idonii TaxID=1193500 RepID=A0A4R9LYW7_9LEPT|nr:ribosome small subunit-dependent GTPase A [Leptospira idonii]TGN18922.1 ribosome small subunit-dependent GTPase A [Leptospira idonii]